jgi:EAL domain-containing protein (putative c-di-GMP-specific phosphodiesterase class I)
LRAAIALAKELKIEVIVEGVETAKQLQRVKSCGGRDVQGYYFSKPLGADAMTALLGKGSFRSMRPAVLLEALAG